MNAVIILQHAEAVQVLHDIAATIQPPPPDVFMSLKEAAAELGVSVDTLSGLAHAGKVPCRDLGTGDKARFVFSKNAISEWLKNSG
jgi:excisionase family DNA binding protein